MSDAVHHATFPTAPSELRSRIGWICHAVRIAAVLWIGWGFATLLIVWRDKAQVTEGWGRLFAMDLSGISDARYGAAFVVALVDIAFAAVVVVCVWRLAGTYLAGRVFTLDAALWLRRTGLAGISAVIVSVLVRVVVTSILVGQFLPISSSYGYYIYLLPQDLLHVIFAVFVFALAHIFKAAAEMAEDQAQIV